jgi:predicted Fe-Mo cluster-binding NifX family protein
MKLAIAIWNSRISPVFDVSRKVRLLEVNNGSVVSAGDQSLLEEDPDLKLRRLAALGADTLICGAVSNKVREMALARGFTLIPFVAGEVEAVIEAWLNGTLKHAIYRMPGCRVRQCAFRGRGRTRPHRLGHQRSGTGDMEKE